MADSAARISTDRGSPERFGYSWDRYSGILPEHEEQFRRWTAPLGPSDWTGKRILDGGCGVGRNTYWPMTYGAASALAIDVDQRTLKQARQNLSTFPTADVKYQSLYEIPQKEEFDIAFSIGVIHHLEFPDRAVAGLATAVKPGGKVLVWLYGRENNGWIVHLLDPIRIGLLSRLPLGFVHWLSLPLTGLLWLFLKMGFGSLDYFKLLRTFTFEHLRAIVFDHLIPKIALYYRRQEAIALLEQAGLCDVEAHWVNQMSWTVIGSKPHAPNPKSSSSGQ